MPANFLWHPVLLFEVKKAQDAGQFFLAFCAPFASKRSTECRPIFRRHSEQQICLWGASLAAILHLAVSADSPAFLQIPQNSRTKGSRLRGRTFLARIPGQREHAEGRSLPEFLDKGSMLGALLGRAPREPRPGALLGRAPRERLMASLLGSNSACGGASWAAILHLALNADS